MWTYTFFPRLLNMSLTAGIVIICILPARLLLKKAPKIFSYALWAVVLFRLLCPVSISSEWSLLNVLDVPFSEKGSIEYIPAVTIPIPGISETINENLPQGEEQTAADPLEFPMSAATFVWLIGMLAMLLHSILSLIKLRRRLIGAIHLRDAVYLADYISSPFVIGLLRPKIYLPSTLPDQERVYIIQHEQHHIRRFDPIIRILAFTALCVHWFNPLVWLAFVLSGKDMEMSCDEAVMKTMDNDIRVEYSTSLLSLSTGKRIIAGMPLAFGEGSTKSRIKNVMNYRKPTFWVIIASTVVVFVGCVTLLTNPSNDLRTIFNSAPTDVEPIKAAAKGLEKQDGIAENTTVADENELTSNRPVSKSLAELPAIYPVEDAIADGNYVSLINGSHNEDVMAEFINNIDAGEPAFVRTVTYTRDGDPIICDFSFDGEVFAVTVDNTRDKFGNPQTLSNNYNNLITYEQSGRLYYVITDLTEITQEQQSSGIDGVVLKYDVLNP